jgi:hypothetical protein
MRRRGAALIAVSLVAAALTTASGLAATADPPPLDSVVLTAQQAGPGYSRFTMDGGRQVKGQVTLDFCGGGYRSESLRLRRLQTIYAPGHTGDAQLSNEVVRYAPGGAKQALREVARRVRTCPRTAVQSPVPGNGTERYLSVALIYDSGLLAGAVAIRMTVEVTEDGRKVRRDIIAIYQRHGNFLSGVYASGGTAASRLANALHAARASADNLLRSDLVTA